MANKAPTALLCAGATGTTAHVLGGTQPGAQRRLLAWPCLKLQRGFFALDLKLGPPRLCPVSCASFPSSLFLSLDDKQGKLSLLRSLQRILDGTAANQVWVFLVSWVPCAPDSLLAISGIAYMES